MNLITIALTLAIGITACANPEPPTDPTAVNPPPAPGTEVLPDAVATDILTRLGAAWATHVATDVTDLYTDDGTVLNSNSGVLTRGRDALTALIAEEHAGLMAGTQRATTLVGTHALRPDVILVDATVVVSADDPAREGFPSYFNQVLVLERDADAYTDAGARWRISDARAFRRDPPRG